MGSGWWLAEKKKGSQNKVKIERIDRALSAKIQSQIISKVIADTVTNKEGIMQDNVHAVSIVKNKDVITTDFVHEEHARHNLVNNKELGKRTRIISPK